MSSLSVVFILMTLMISLMIGKGLTQAAAFTIIYILLTAVTVLSILILKTIRSLWEQESTLEVPYDSQA